MFQEEKWMHWIEFISNFCRGDRFRLTSHLHNIRWHGPSCSHLERLHSVCLCFSAPLASPWPPSLPVSLHQLHFCLWLSVRAPLLHPSWPELRDRWATRPLTVITDPFPSHHLAPDLLSLSSEHRALFLQSQAQEVVMIPVHLGHSPWANSKSNSCGWFCPYYCTDFILLV